MFVVVLVTAASRRQAASQAKTRRAAGGDVLCPSDLDPRSLAVLELLSREPVLSSHHVRELVFPGGTEASRAELCRRTLRRLTAAGLLYRARTQRGQLGGGSRPSVYALTAKGDRWLQLHDGRSLGRSRRRPAETGTALRDHQLAIADVQVALVAAGRARKVPVRWTGEPRCWWVFIGANGRERLKPDGFAEVDLPHVCRLAWLELDRGTQSVPTTIAAKVRRYCRAAVARAAGDEPVPLVIFVVPGAKRRKRITEQRERWAGRERLSAPAAARLIQVVSPSGVVPLLLGTEGIAE